MSAKKCERKVVRTIITLLAALALVVSMKAVPVYAASYDITVTTDGHGTSSGPASAEEGTRQLLIITPDEGYVFDSVSATGISEGDTGTTYSLMYSGWPDVGIMINELPANDVSFDVKFAAAVTATYDANGGTKGPMWSDTRIIKKGQTETFNIDPDLISPPAGKEYDGVEVNGVRVGPSDSYTYNSDVSVVYQWKDPDTDTPRCLVTYDANGGILDEAASAGRSIERGAVEEVRLISELATAPEGMEFDAIEVNGVQYKIGESWVVPDVDSVTVKFIWKNAADGGEDESGSGDDSGSGEDASGSGDDSGSGGNDGSGGNGGADGNNVPLTGDENDLVLWILLAGIAVSGIILVKRRVG